MTADRIAFNVDPDLCGMGQGADCCAYLTLGPAGFECNRDAVNFKEIIAARLPTMSAQRCPTMPYPECQSEPLLDLGDTP